jgi:hypothetical protein
MAIISGGNFPKKNPLPPSGLVTDFWMSRFGVRLDHYQPFVIIADDDLGDDNENKVEKIDNGAARIHESTHHVFGRR